MSCIVWSTLDDFMVLHPIGETFKNKYTYVTFAWLTFSQSHVCFINVETCFAAVCCIVFDYMLHQYWRYFARLLASQLKKFRYRTSNDSFVFVDAFWNLKCSVWGFRNLTVIKSNHSWSMIFNAILYFTRVGLASLGVPWGHCVSFWQGLFMLLASFFAAYYHRLKNRGGGGGESTVS